MSSLTSTNLIKNCFIISAWHVRLKPYYDKPVNLPETVAEEKSSELKSVKLESGSGSEKENEVKTAEKKRKRGFSSDSESQEDPDFELKPKSTKTEESKKEPKDKKRDKEKEKKKKDKDRDRDREKDKDRVRSKDSEKHKSDKHKERSHHHNISSKDKTEKSSDSKLSYKLTEPQSFEKLITESAAGNKQKSEKSVEERRSMSQLFPGQIKAESVKKKLALTPHSSPSTKVPHHLQSHSSSTPNKSPHTKQTSSSDSQHKKPEPASASPVKKILNFDNPSRSVNILDQIMSTMSFPANKE